MLRLGIAHHFGWAVAVTCSAQHEVVDRRRIELVEPGVASAPIHREGKALDDRAAEVLVAEVRASARRATDAALRDLAASVAPATIVSISLRAWPEDFPDEIEVLRRVPYEARADSVMYRQLLADAAAERGWSLHLFDAKRVVGEAERVLGERAADVLDGPRRILGPPWTKDHRMAVAATVIAASSETAVE